MTVIATNFLNLPFADEIMDAFKEYSNEYEFTAEGVFRRINSPACPRCGKRMSHNGYNRYHLLDLAVIKLGKISLQEMQYIFPGGKYIFDEDEI